MATYVTLMKFTDQGIKDVKNLPARVEKAIATWERMGGKMVAFYLTMGQYDIVTIGEAPNDEVAAAFALGLGAEGNVRTEALRAFSQDQAGAIVKALS